jgi:hypothetical protein
MLLMRNTRKWVVSATKTLTWAFTSFLIRMDIGWKLYLKDNISEYDVMKI